MRARTTVAGVAQPDLPIREVPIHPAATVLLLRDTPNGIEVFMLRRTNAAAFAGGMYVFPGGRVDPADGDGDHGYVVAAIRECYEEAGVLLAVDTAGNSISDGHPALDHRHAVHGGHTDLQTLCDEHQLRLATEQLVWISRWVTPAGESARRFDTRFFLAVAPPGQTSHHDDTETVASEWLRPEDALRRAANNELGMMPPTVSNLEALLPHGTADQAIAWARQQPRPEPIHPKLRRNASGRIIGIAMPGDPDYADLD